MLAYDYAVQLAVQINSSKNAPNESRCSKQVRYALSNIPQPTQTNFHQPFIDLISKRFCSIDRSHREKGPHKSEPTTLVCLIIGP